MSKAPDFQQKGNRHDAFSHKHDNRGDVRSGPDSLTFSSAIVARIAPDTSADCSIFSSTAENFIRAGDGATNDFAVEVSGRSLRWKLNRREVGTVTARVPVGGAVSTYLEGQGMQVVVRNLKVTSL